MNKSLLDTDTLSEITKGINSAVAAKANAYRRLFHRYSQDETETLRELRWILYLHLGKPVPPDDPDRSAPVGSPADRRDTNQSWPEAIRSLRDGPE